MRRSGRVLLSGWGLFVFLLATPVAFAGWDFTPPGDPTRNWGVSLTSSVGYDDNFNGTETDRQSGYRLGSDLNLRASVPLERAFVGGQYDYGVTYPQDVKLGGINQTHNLNLSANYSFSPRLTLGLTENFVKSLQPGIVLGPANAPITVQFAGTYIYDLVGCVFNYALTPRWTLSLGANWDIWRYDNPIIATSNDREDYSTTVSALYALDSRTTVGLNYQYIQNLYSFPGVDDILNGVSHTAYLSYVRRFNPRLSLQLNGGYTLRTAGSGDATSAPSGLAALTYNYAQDSSLSLNFAQSLSEASVGITREFSAEENTSASVALIHQITTRLKVNADVSYVFSTFKQSVSTFSVSGQEEQLTSHIILGYAFTQWLSANLGYSYTRIFPSTAFVVTPYYRNQVSIGMTLTY